MATLLARAVGTLAVLTCAFPGSALCQPSVYLGSEEEDPARFFDYSPEGAGEADRYWRFHPDAQLYYIAERGQDTCCAWSPDGRRLLMILRYQYTDYGNRGLRANLAFINYSKTLPQGGIGAAILVVDLDARRISPLRLPFTLERIPSWISWWDDESLLLVGRVEKGVLANQYPERPMGLTRLHLDDLAVSAIDLPRDDTFYGTVDFMSTALHFADRIAVSFTLSQAAGGGEGVLFFDVDGTNAFETRELWSSHLREGTFTADRLTGEDWSFRVLEDRLEEEAVPDRPSRGIARLRPVPQPTATGYTLGRDAYLEVIPRR